jgi:DNA-binding IclR family transcriptional regulator
MLTATMRLVNHNVDHRVQEGALAGAARIQAVEGARAVSKALALLEAFTPARPWWTVAELAAAVGMPASTVTRLVSALEGGGVLRREDGGFRYTIGHRVLLWASIAKGSTNLHALAHPLLEDLRNQTGETAALYLRQGIVRVCLDVVQSSQQVHRALPLGEVAPLTMGAAGRSIAAYLPPEERQMLGFPSNELGALQRVPSFGGVVCSLRDRLKDAWAIAAPIHGADGGVSAALVVTGPISRFRNDLFGEYAPSVLRAARAVSEKLGCPPHMLGTAPADFTGIPIFGSGPFDAAPA